MPQRAATVSVASNSTLILVKLGLGVATHSVSVVSEALHSLNDLTAAIIALYAVRKSAEPADESHPFGHGKFESMSGAVEGFLIFLAAAAILFQAGDALLSRQYLSTAVGGMIAMGVSMLVNIVVSTYLYRVARATDSLALEADALHLRTDLYSCAGVFLGLLIIEISGLKWLDPLLGIMVACVIMTAAYRLTGRSVGDLLDRNLPAEEREKLTRILEAHSELGIRFHRVRARRSGPLRHIDLHLETPPDMTVQRAHEICDHLEQDIVAALPRARVLIHTEPLGNKTD
jgi:cation diffusion facilitator family transporter